MNGPLIDLKDYEQGVVELDHHSLIKPLLLLFLLGTACFVVAQVWPNRELAYAMGFGFVVVLTSTMIVLERKFKSAYSTCKKCGGQNELRTADVDPQDCQVLGGLLNPIRFTAYGRSYAVESGEMDGRYTSSCPERYVQLLQQVAVCEKCKRYLVVSPCVREPLNSNDIWVIDEHKNGTPIPMDLAPGQTLTQFELEQAAVDRLSLCESSAR